jgi:hypothetical protein
VGEDPAVTEHTDSDPTTRPSRRVLLRTGATAAWTAPVIVAVSAAPAYAVSPGGEEQPGLPPDFEVAEKAAAHSGTVVNAIFQFFSDESRTFTVIYTLRPVAPGASAPDGWTVVDQGTFTTVSGAVAGVDRLDAGIEISDVESVSELSVFLKTAGYTGRSYPLLGAGTEI